MIHNIDEKSEAGTWQAAITRPPYKLIWGQVELSPSLLLALINNDVSGVLAEEAAEAQELGPTAVQHRDRPGRAGEPC